MRREEYTAAVLRGLHRVTEKEKDALRRELDGHMEDHMLALAELGYDEAAAEEKAVAAMGDPAETARELQKCYSFGWLVAGYVMEAVLALLLIACIAGSITVGSGIIDAVKTRLIPTSYLTAEQRRDARELDIRVDCGGSEVKFFAIRPVEPDQAEIYACIYSKRLFSHVADSIQIGYYAPGEREMGLTLRDGNTAHTSHRVYHWRRLEVPEGADCVDAVIEWLGEERIATIPIEWEAAS